MLDKNKPQETQASSNRRNKEKEEYNRKKDP